MVRTPAVQAQKDGILAVFSAWSPLAPDQQRLKAEYEAFVQSAGPAALSRDGGPEHLTGSCFVLTPDLSRVLLCFHRKGQFWVQLGGHVEAGDVSVADAVSVVSSESESVAWFEVDRLPEQVPDGFPARLRTVLAELANRRRAAPPE